MNVSCVARPYVVALGLACTLALTGCASFMRGPSTARVALHTLFPASKNQIDRAARQLTPNRSLASDRGWVLVPTHDAEYRWQHDQLDRVLELPKMHAEAVLVRASKSSAPVIRATAAIGLARLGAGTATPLRRIVMDVNLPDSVRRAAVETLGAQGFHGTVRSLLTHYSERKTESGVRAELLLALPIDEVATNRDRAIAALSSVHEDVVYAATRLLLNEQELSPEVMEVIDPPQGKAPTVAARVGAIKAIGDYPLPAALGLLLKTAGDRQHLVRAATLKALGRFKAEEAIRALRKVARDENASVSDRQAAVIGLGLSKQYALVYQFVEQKEWQIREAVASALESDPSAEGIRIAEQLINDSSLSVAKRTMKSLREWPVEISGAVLITGAQVDARQTIRNAANQILADHLAFGKRLPRGASNSDALRTELLLLQTAWEKQHGSIKEFWAKVRNRHDFARQWDPQRLSIELAALSSPESWIQDKAIAALVRQAERAPLSAENRQALIRTLRQTSSPAAWQAAFRVLNGRLSDEATELVSLAKRHASEKVRRQALEFIEKYPEGRFGNVISELLHAPEDEVRRAALRCVLSTQDHIDLSAIDQLLSDADPVQRVLAATAVWQRHKQRGKQLLITLAAHSDAEIRRHLAVMVGEQRIRSLKTTLIGMLDDVAEVRLAAADALVEIVEDDVAVLRARQLATPQQRVQFWRKWAEKR